MNMTAQHTKCDRATSRRQDATLHTRSTFAHLKSLNWIGEVVLAPSMARTPVAPTPKPGDAHPHRFHHARDAQGGREGALDTDADGPGGGVQCELEGGRGGACRASVGAWTVGHATRRLVAPSTQRDTFSQPLCPAGLTHHDRSRLHTRQAQHTRASPADPLMPWFLLIQALAGMQLCD